MASKIHYKHARNLILKLNHLLKCAWQFHHFFYVPGHMCPCARGMKDRALYLVQPGFSKIEPVTYIIMTFLPKNTGIKLKTMHVRGIYEKIGQVT